MQVSSEGLRSRRLATVGIAVAGASVLLFGAAHLVNAWVFDREIGPFDAGAGDSAFERMGNLAIALSLLAVLLLAIRAGSVSAALLVPLLGFLLVDDLLGIHEHVPSWRILYLPLLAAVFYLLWRFEYADRDALRLARVGLVLLVASVVLGVVAERIVVRQGWTTGDAGYEAKILVKDGSEVAGWILIATALVATAAFPIRR